MVVEIPLTLRFSAIIGIGEANELPPAEYVCEVFATNILGDGNPTESLPFLSGSTCDTGATAEVYEGWPVQQYGGSGATVVRNYFPLAVWWNRDQEEQGSCAVRSLPYVVPATDPAVTVGKTPGELDLAVELSTTENVDDKISVSYSGTYNINENFAALTPKSLNELMSDDNFAITYSWFKLGGCTGANCDFAAPALSIRLYSESPFVLKEGYDPVNEALLKFEPTYNLEFTDPSTGLGVNGKPPVNTWYTFDIVKSMGSSGPVTFPGSPPANSGWWISPYGQAGDFRFSMQAWVEYWDTVNGGGVSNNIFITDISVSLGSYNRGNTGFTNDIGVSFTESGQKATVPTCIIDN